MKNVSTDCKSFFNDVILGNAETTFGISIRSDIRAFFAANNGGYPTKDIIVSDGDEYEVRAFLSLDRNDENYCLEKPLSFFLSKTNARIIPIALDSGDNYYCVNNETGKVYYWRAGSDRYYLIAERLEVFVSLFIN